IALVFGVELNHFFSRSGPRIAVTRGSERLKLPIPANAVNPSYLFESLNFPLTDRKLEAFIAEFPVGAPESEPHQHGSEEVLYVLSGRLAVTVDGEEHLLKAGDSISFDSSISHWYRRSGDGPC